MMLRYRPSANLLIICGLLLALLVLNYLFLVPTLQASQAQLHDATAMHQRIKEQIGQKPSEHDKRMLAQAAWQGNDWPQAIIDAMNAAQSQAQSIKASYSLGVPASAVFDGVEYFAQRVDLEIAAPDDPTAFRFIATLLGTLPGVSAVTSLEMRQETATSVNSTLSLTLYRMVQP